MGSKHTHRAHSTYTHTYIHTHTQTYAHTHTYIHAYIQYDVPPCEANTLMELTLHTHTHTYMHTYSMTFLHAKPTHSWSSLSTKMWTFGSNISPEHRRHTEKGALFYDMCMYVYMFVYMHVCTCIIVC